MNKEDLKELKWGKNNGDLSELMKSKVGKFSVLNNCIAYLKVEGNFPSGEGEL